MASAADPKYTIVPQRQRLDKLGRRTADLDVRWLEEPVSSDDLDGLREIRDAVQADVTACEYGYDLYYFRRMCAAGAVDCLQVGGVVRPDPDAPGLGLTLRTGVSGEAEVMIWPGTRDGRKQAPGPHPSPHPVSAKHQGNRNRN